MKASRRIKTMHRKQHPEMSLKEFSRHIRTLGEGELSDQWLKNKSPTQEQKDKAERLARKGKQLAEIRAAAQNKKATPGKK